MARSFYTVKATDVNRRFLRIFGRTWPLVNCCGYIQKIDVGKRIYLINNDEGTHKLLGMENDEQLHERQDREKS